MLRQCNYKIYETLYIEHKGKEVELTVFKEREKSQIKTYENIQEHIDYTS